MRPFFAPLVLAFFVALARADGTCAKFKYGIAAPIPINIGGGSFHQCMVSPTLMCFVLVQRRVSTGTIFDTSCNVYSSWNNKPPVGYDQNGITLISRDGAVHDDGMSPCTHISPFWCDSPSDPITIYKGTDGTT